MPERLTCQKKLFGLLEISRHPMVDIKWEISQTLRSSESCLMAIIHPMAILRLGCRFNVPLFQNISIDNIVSHPLCNDLRQYLRVYEGISSIHKDTILSMCHCNSFIHCIIDTLIRCRSIYQRLGGLNVCQILRCFVS